MSSNNIENRKWIIVKGAKEHNLKNINVNIPRDSFTVITGVSGSGKSSLAFDTLYAEGQRRYVESLSSYARQFLGIMKKPAVDYIEGLSPAISIEQKGLNRNPRSTVGTITEIYDYLRLLYTHISHVFCYNCGKEIKTQTIDQIVESVMKNEVGSKIQILAPVIENKKGTFINLFENFKKLGFYRVIVDGELKTLEDEINLDKNRKHSIYIVVNRVIIDEEKRKTIFESIEQALSIASGKVIIDKESEKKFYSTKFSCPECDISYPDLKPSLFSFNSPNGACTECHGLGFKLDFDLDKVIDFNLSIKDGAIKPFKLNEDSWTGKYFSQVFNFFNISQDVSLKDLEKEKLNILLYGSDKKIDLTYEGENYTLQSLKSFEGIINILRRRFNETKSDELKDYYYSFMKEIKCSVCNGNRLNNFALSCKIKDRGNNFYDIMELSKNNVKKIYEIVDNIIYPENIETAVKDILREIKSRLKFLINVGLDYITLDRMAYTLSGGEAQRITLATQIGSQLVGVMYILDEPTIGLHQRDNEKLIKTLKELKDLGNTLIVVEHDKQVMLESDYIVDLGPYAGINGGYVVFQGNKEEFLKSDSLTAKYLRNEKKVYFNTIKRKGNGKYIEISGCRMNNLKNINVKFPLNTFICVTGVSGSGKSTLVIDLLYDVISRIINGNKNYKNEFFDKITGIENLERVIHIDQTPIGRTPRSNPATYTGVFNFIRDLFAELPESKIRGYKPGRFSFNVKGGRCENCYGDGEIKIEMQFLADVYVTCEVCGGKRYNSQTLEVKYKGKNIYEVLEMSIDEAYEFFKNIPPIENKLKIMQDVGIGYLKLGQSAPTLSGGEAQRIKLSKELSRVIKGNTIYFLDEPTTGLHFEDIDKLIKVLHRLVDKGNTVVVIEHNLDVIKNADYIIDLGPEGGENGGEIIYQGYYDEFLKCTKSYTSYYIKNSF
ncbi:MAG: excinuclease ABC subunit UvrA [Spirochaetes bacterium]|nr:excinuclease ABC subunit UvrA [Spirochaetota bacterium]